MADVTVKHTPSGGPADPSALVDGPTYDNDPHIVTGLENVDNTSDLDKPVSTATQTALDAKISSSLLTTRGDIIVRNATVPARLPIGGVGEVLTSDGTDAAWAAPSGGGGTPGGSDTQVQFNNAGSFGGISGATTDGTILSVTTAAVDTNTTQAASTAMVLAQAASATPLGNAPTAVVGTATRFARADHVHPGREVLTAARTYYVRKDGSDSNTGLADNAGGAFLTIQKAVNVACALDFSIYTVTINVRAGTYNENINLKPYLGTGPLSITGDQTTPANVIINATGGFGAINNQFTGKNFVISGFRIQASGSNSHALNAFGGGTITYFDRIDFGVCGSYHMWVNSGGYIAWTGFGTASISGGTGYHILMQQNAMCDFRGLTYSIPSAVAFSGAWVRAIQGSSALLGNGSFTGAGVAGTTGKRYDVQENSAVNVAGGGASYFPGSIAGTTATGGQYN